MKILHVSAVKDWGGGENHIENLCSELKAYPEAENFILCPKNSKFHDKLKLTSFKFKTAKLDFNLDPRFCLKIIQICSKQEIDIIHIHDPTALILCVMADKIYNLPPFVFSKKTSFPIKTRKTTLYKYNYPKIEKILCVSHKTRKITAVNIYDSNKLEVIYHGTNLNTKSTCTPFQIRKHFEITANAKIIGNIAKHTRVKDLETFINCANYLVNERNRKDVHFVQFGMFTQKKTHVLKALIKKYNLENHFHFAGFIDDASNFIPQMDVFLLTSYSEGLPGVIYESFYHEVPVVSTNVGGIPEIIQHNKNGLLADVYDFKLLGDHLLKIINNPEFASKLSHGNRKLIEDHFSTNQMAQKTLKVYKEIYNGRSK